MSALAQFAPVSHPHNDLFDLSLSCVHCRGLMIPPNAGAGFELNKYTCARCNSPMDQINDIWKAMRADRARYLAASLSAYEAVRKAEGRWREDSRFYLSLPWRDTSALFCGQWKVRAQSFKFLQRRIFPALMRRMGHENLRILDLGAGNCWMSYRLTQAGHSPVAVDISVSSGDGLGAARHFRETLQPMFPRFQAEMDCLPFSSGQFDLAIFNASFHYSQNYAATLREILRVLSPRGAILIVDSPTYRRESDGEAMKKDKSAEFTRRFGSDRGTMGGEQYITAERLARVAFLGIRWQRYSPWYGWRWALRPAIASIARRRAPSRFYIYLGLSITDEWTTP